MKLEDVVCQGCGKKLEVKDEIEVLAEDEKHLTIVCDKCGHWIRISKDKIVKWW
jgi:uncharacterized Zn finger protein